VANQRGDLQEAVDLAQKALEQMAGASDERITPIFRGSAVIWLGVNYRQLGYLDRAGPVFLEAASLNQKAGNYYGAVASVEQRGDLATIQGHLHRAAEIYRQGLEMVQQWSGQEAAGRGGLPATTGLYFGLGSVLYQWNDLAGAATYLQRACDLGESGRFWGRMHCYCMLAYVKHAEKDYQAAYDLLRQASSIRDSLSFRQINITAEPGLEQLRILLGRAQPHMAHLLADAASEVEIQGLKPDDDIEFAGAPGYAQEPQYSDLARVLIALGRASDALPLLDRLLEAAQSMGRRGDAIRYLVLQAVASHSTGDKPSALASLSQALTLAEPEGYVRVFVDEGEPMAELLQAVSSQRLAVSQTYVDGLLLAFGEVLRTPEGSALVEPLSERELEVLRLMDAGLKHKEVAEELVISLNTVRHHARNIYGKLGVNSRGQAVGRARDLDLL
jgi:LuxR family maltose regulon positive regulatory protein